MFWLAMPVVVLAVIAWRVHDLADRRWRAIHTRMAELQRAHDAVPGYLLLTVGAGTDGPGRGLRLDVAVALAPGSHQDGAGVNEASAQAIAGWVAVFTS